MVSFFIFPAIIRQVGDNKVINYFHILSKMYGSYRHLEVSKIRKTIFLPLCPLRGNTDSLQIKNTLFQLVQCIFKTLYPRMIQLYLLFSGVAVLGVIWLSFGCHKTTFFFLTDAPQPAHKFWDTLMSCSSSGC